MITRPCNRCGKLTHYHYVCNDCVKELQNMGKDIDDLYEMESDAYVVYGLNRKHNKE